MENYSNLKRFIDWAEQYEQTLTEGQEWNDTSFAIWLNDKLNVETEAEKQKTAKAKSSLAMSVYFMYKYALFYSRKVFKQSQIYSLDDFSFLASLMPDKKLKKADVIRKNVSEKSSGNEVLKRLLKQQLITEIDNPEDKRSKLLSLTPAGMAEIFAIKEQMYKMGNLVDGDLSDEEKAIMLKLLNKLHEFHKPIFENNDEEFLKEQLGIGIKN